MALSIVFVIIFTLIIHLVDTLGFAVRIVGVKTGKLAITFALFNIVVLASRLSGTFQAPLLANWIEDNINLGLSPGTFEMRMILLGTTLGTMLAGFLVPTSTRILVKSVNTFNLDRSIPRLLLHAFTKSGIKQFRQDLVLPNKDNFNVAKSWVVKDFPVKIFIYNIVAVAILTVGVLSAMYAGLLVPELRSTAISLAPVVNSMATILLLLFIDPYMSALTDDVIEGKFNEVDFTKVVRIMVVSRLLGTILAQFLLMPFSKLIAWLVTLF